MKIKARDLIQYTPRELSERLFGDFILVFDDGELNTYDKETIYSSFAWRFHSLYPNTPLLKKHHIRYILGNKRLGNRTHLELLGNAMWSAYDANKEVVNKDEMIKMIYEISQSIYCELSLIAEPYITSVDFLDFIELMDYQSIKDVLSSIEPNQASIDKSYKVIGSVVKNSELLTTNPLGKNVRSGLIKFNQLLQCVGPRGYLTDIDSHIFPNPIMNGYVKGMRSLHDSMIESRSAAKSLFMAKEPLEQAEYFSRKLQLVCMAVRNLHHTDCGSTKYLTIKIRGLVEDAPGQTAYAGDLVYWEGKYYLDEETNTLKALKTTDTHLIGRTLKFRSPIAGCAHPDPYGVCRVCFGELADNIPDNSNLGHICNVALTQQSSQLVLSTKHYDGSSTVESIVLSNHDRGYFKTGDDGTSYILEESLKKKNVKLLVPQEEALGLTDINLVEHVREIPISRISEIRSIALQYNEKDSEFTIPFGVNIGRRLSSFTHYFLDYVKKNGWTVDSKGNYCFNLNNWDFSKAILSLPLQHASAADHSMEIADIIESRVDQLSKRDGDTTVETILMDLADLVNSKLRVHMSALEINVYGAMIVSAIDGNFKLPKANTSKAMGVTSVTIPNRSHGAALGFQGHKDFILSPRSYYSDNRPSHPMDVFILPEETLKELNL